MHSWQLPSRIVLSCSDCGSELSSHAYYTFVFDVEKGPYCGQCCGRLEGKVRQVEREREERTAMEMEYTLRQIRELPEVSQEGDVS